jgi:hypothetical protein
MTPMHVSKPFAWPIPFIPIVLAAQILTGCSFTPRPVVQYRAISDGSIWNQGLELHSAKTERLDLRAGFLEYRTETVRDYSGPHPLYFRIEAANRSDQAVLIDPVDFRLTVPGSDSVFDALDPEAVVLQTRKDRASEDARYLGDLSVSAASNVATFGIDVLNIFAKQTKEEKEDWGKSKEQSRNNQEYDEQRHRDAAERLSRRESLWADSALRKATLPPGGRIAGRVGFAVESYGPTPDTLRIQYRERTGGFTDLIAFGIVRDSAETARIREAKALTETGKPLHNGPPTGVTNFHRPLRDGPANNPGRGQ